MDTWLAEEQRYGWQEAKGLGEHFGRNYKWPPELDREGRGRLGWLQFTNGRFWSPSMMECDNDGRSLEQRQCMAEKGSC